MNIRRLVGGGEAEEGACDTIEYGEEEGEEGGGGDDIYQTLTRYRVFFFGTLNIPVLKL